MAKRSIGVGLVGLGVVGGQVARVLLGKSGTLEEQAGCPVVLRRVKVLDVDLSRPQAQEMPHQLLTTDEDNFFTTAGIDIIVEAIGGEEPARRYLERALGAGKHVVTANKEVIAKYGTELITLAQRQQVSLNYEAAVGGGIPLIAPFQRDLVANDIKGIYSIINGTTNYILTRMSREGTDFATALDQAQELGYAEDDPGNDIDGIDAAYKLAILASLAFQSRIRPDEIFCEGIARLSSRDFRYAQELGFAIKLLAIAKKSNNSIEARVHPVFIPEDYFLAKVDGVYNAVLVEGDLCGQITFLGKGAGALPTASAIVADVVRAARDIVYGVGAQTVWKVQPDRFIKPMPDVITRYYIRMNIADSAGVLAQIAGLLGEGNISISSAIQKEADEKTRTAEIVIMTHPAQEKAMQRAMEKLGRLEAVKEISTFVRVED
jgi:homoserine dehydrogenase